VSCLRKPKCTNTIPLIRSWLVEEDNGYDTTCRVWPYARYPVGWGYGLVNFEGKSRKVHKILWEAENGPVLVGFELDHLCRVLPCALTSHIEPTTHRENVLRGVGLTALNALKTHCDAGHPLFGSNLKIRVHSNGQLERFCIQCNRDRAAAYHAAQRAVRVGG
jgi:hypothetical protein